MLGGGGFQSSRIVGAALATANPGVLTFGTRLRAAYEIAGTGWYLRPYTDVDLAHARMAGFQESGPVGVALAVRDSAHTSVSVAPILELGGRFDAGQGATLRLYAALGLSLHPSNTRGVDASFVGSAPGSGAFRTFVRSPAILGSADLGAQLYRDGGFEVRLEYGLRVGGSYLGQTASGRVVYHCRGAWSIISELRAWLFLIG